MSQLEEELGSRGRAGFKPEALGTPTLGIHKEEITVRIGKEIDKASEVNVGNRLKKREESVLPSNEAGRFDLKRCGDPKR